jgi:hypothetical protein
MAVFHAVNYAITYIQTILKPVDQIGGILSVGKAFGSAANYLMSLFNGALQLFAGEGYHNEVFADRFAGAYGYGADLSKALSKSTEGPGATTNDREVKKAGFAALMIKTTRILSAVSTILYCPLGPHPSLGSRVSDQLRFLDEEIDRTKNPRLREALKKERDSLREVVDDIIDSIPEATYKGMTVLDKVKEAISGISGRSMDEIDADIQESVARIATDAAVLNEASK